MKKEDLKYGKIIMHPSNVELYMCNPGPGPLYGAIAEVIAYHRDQPVPKSPKMFVAPDMPPCPIHMNDDAGSLGERFHHISGLLASRIEEPARKLLVGYIKFLVPPPMASEEK